ncbi:myosin-9-like [Macadamia integrifolia]|uniref:myosin-9-like n=1 Tax=Macadamia integrifolia TaxID=60698 RepID=UPI001C5015F1|nr:myosin-9-like [Macadamia integrifolia]
MSTTRRPKWKPPPPPSPKILHLPRRTRRKATKKVAIGKFIPVREPDSLSNHREKLETLFDQESSFSHTVPMNSGDSERRGRVKDFDYGYGEKGRDLEDEKWRFQAEILRAECQFLRMEREIALKKLEKSRVQMERTLRSAVETLISVRKRIYEGKNFGVVLEEEIEDLEEKLEELQRRSPGRFRDFDVQKCSNFDKQATILQRRLEKIGGRGISEDESVKEIREIAEASLAIDTNCRSVDSFVSNRKTRFTDVENLGRKMEGLSKKMLEKMEEEYKSMVSITTTSTSSSFSSSGRIEFPDTDPSSIIRPHHPQQRRTETVCSGRCKSTVRKIVEQVRAETEQWTQMQEMLGQVREEMEELRASRDFLEDRAIHCGDRIRSLHSTEQKWRQKAVSSENMVTKLQKQISDLYVELERLRSESEKKPTRDTQKEKEKRVLICRLKENHHIGSSCNIGKQNKAYSCSSGLVTARNRSPLQVIGNSSPLNKQSSLP